jgi:hypothetical protein
MFTYNHNKCRGWTEEWIDKINAQPMISNDKISFFDPQKFEILQKYVKEKHDLEIYHLISSIQKIFWEEHFTENLANDIFKNLDKLEIKYKQIVLNKKLDAIEKDF